MHRASFWLMVLVWARVAVAQDLDGPRVASVLTVNGTDACLSRDALLARTVHWLGTDRVRDAVTVEVDTGAPVRFVVRRGGEVSERRFDVLPRECAARVDAISLAVALAIDASVVERLGSVAAVPDPAVALATPAQVDPGVAAATPLPVPAPSAGVVPMVPRSPLRAPARFALLAGAAALVRVLPGAAFAAVVGGEFDVSTRLRLRAGGIYSSRGEGAIAGGSVAAFLTGGFLDGCVGRPMGRFRGDGCVGVLAGAIAASGSGFAENRTRTDPFVAAEAGVALQSPPLGPVALRLRAGALVPLATGEVRADDQSGAVLARRSAVTLGVFTALELRVTIW